VVLGEGPSIRKREVEEALGIAPREAIAQTNQSSAGPRNAEPLNADASWMIGAAVLREPLWPRRGRRPRAIDRWPRGCSV